MNTKKRRLGSYAVQTKIKETVVIEAVTLLSTRPIMGLFIRTIQVLVEDLGHGKHVDAVLLEDGAHRIVTADLASVVWVLEFVFTYILPELFDRLRSRKLDLSDRMLGANKNQKYVLSLHPSTMPRELGTN